MIGRYHDNSRYHDCEIVGEDELTKSKEEIL